MIEEESDQFILRSARNITNRETITMPTTANPFQVLLSEHRVLSPPSTVLETVIHLLVLPLYATEAMGSTITELGITDPKEVKALTDNADNCVDITGAMFVAKDLFGKNNLMSLAKRIIGVVKSTSTHVYTATAGLTGARREPNQGEETHQPLSSHACASSPG